MLPRLRPPCVCAHTESVHRHYTHSSYCSLCSCNRYRRIVRWIPWRCGFRLPPMLEPLTQFSA